MKKNKMDKIKRIRAYLEKSGLLSLYESFDSVFILLDLEQFTILYANSFVQQTLKIKEGENITEIFDENAKREINDKLTSFSSGAENFLYQYTSRKNPVTCILRFQKVIVGKNSLIVVFSLRNENIKSVKNNIEVKKDYLQILYKISKLLNKINLKEEETLSQIVNVIAEIFEKDNIWIKLTVGGKHYQSKNYSEGKKIITKKLNLIEGENSYLEIGLRTKEGSGTDVKFSLETEKVLEEIIERLEISLNEKLLKDKLEKKEKHFRSIFKHANDAIVVVNSKGEIIDYNKTAKYFFGFSDETLNKKMITDLDESLAIEKLNVLAKISKTLTDENVERETLRFINHVTGNEMFCEITVSNWQLEEEVFFALIFRDITLRIIGERKIRYRSEFENLIATISARFIESGFEKIEENIEFALQLMSEFLGADRACVFLIDYLQQNLSCKYEWAKNERTIDKLQNMNLGLFSEILNSLTSEQVVLVSEGTENKQFSAYLRLRKIRSALGIALYEDDKFTGFIGFEFTNKVFRLHREDISLLVLFGKIIDSEILHFSFENKRREYESQLRKMKEVIEQSPLAIVITDTEGNIEYVNPKFVETTGYESYEVLGKNPRFLKSDYTTKDEYKKLWETIKSGKQWKGVFRNKKKNGEYFWESAIIIPVKDTNGEITNFLAIKEDITEQIKMKNELDLSRKMEAIGQLASGIAHEINSPLQFISGNIEFIGNAFEDFLKYIKETETEIKENIPDNFLGEVEKIIKTEKEKFDIEYLQNEIPEAISQTKEGIEKVTKIVKTMKEYAHPHSGKKEPADIVKAIENTVLLTRNAWKYVADVETDLCENPPRVYCNIDLINQALINVFVNAAQAIEEKIGNRPETKGLIKIETECSNDFITIKISDNGIGIPNEYLDKIFEPFFTTKEVGKGTGQGLALVHDIIVNKHGGTINVETKPNEGTTFIIKLPLKEEDENGKK